MFDRRLISNTVCSVIVTSTVSPGTSTHDVYPGKDSSSRLKVIESIWVKKDSVPKVILNKEKKYI